MDRKELARTTTTTSTAVHLDFERTREQEKNSKEAKKNEMLSAPTHRENANSSLLPFVKAIIDDRGIAQT